MILLRALPPLDRLISPSLLTGVSKIRRHARLLAACALLVVPTNLVIQGVRAFRGEWLAVPANCVTLACFFVLWGLKRGYQPQGLSQVMIGVAGVQMSIVLWTVGYRDAVPLLGLTLTPLLAFPACGPRAGLGWSLLAFGNVAAFCWSGQIPHSVPTTAAFLGSVAFMLPIVSLAAVTMSYGAEIRNVKALEESELLRVEAVTANLAKSQFLAQMSHELRTPLNGIVGIAQLLGHGELTPQQHELITAQKRAAKSLVGIVSDVLDMAKIEAEAVDIEAIGFDLQALLDDVVSLFAVASPGSEVELKGSFSEPLGWARGDSMRLRQVLTNLLGNAVKFTKAGEVALSCHRRGGSVFFEVRDTGIGISVENQEKLFGAFKQAETSTARRFGGTGLGLSISANLVRLMGGNLAVKSTEGEGSTFLFDLELEAVVASDQVSTGSSDSVEVPARVLSVDDNRVNLLVIRRMLEFNGCTVTEASGGQEALDLLAESEFDLILMDCQMPELDGLETTRRALAQGVKCPIVAVTADARAETKAECEQAGMANFITKPVEIVALKELLLSLSVPARD